jgi:pSer/pThr/pTyr-binding forkhead associated (FHA) protein
MDESTTPSANAYLLLNAQIIPLNKPVTTMGRLLENDVVINDPAVSRYHAEIHLEENQFVLVDKESTGGTFLNNKKILRAVLYSGDLISLAGLPLMFVIDSAALNKQTKESTGGLDSDDATKSHNEDTQTNVRR